MNDSPANMNRRSVSILVLALALGAAIFGIVSLVVHYTAGPFIVERPVGKNGWIIYLAIVVIAVTLSRRSYQKRMDQFDQSITDGSGKQKYVLSTLQHLSICEGISILSSILFLLFGEFILFIAIGLCVAEMLRVYFKVRSTTSAPF